MQKLRHGLNFDANLSDAYIEREFLRHGGFMIVNGNKYGLGLHQHFKNYWSLLWPDDSQTRWTDLILKEVLENKFLGIIGPASSWKTGTVSRIGLMDWSLFPECTTVLMSSTDLEGLRSRVYGETSKMWGQAFERYPDWWPGHPIDHKCCIAYEDIDEDAVRDLRNGIVGIANKTSDGKTQGMGKYAGRKNTRMWTICDETQFCETSFLEAQNNLSRNGPCLVPGLKRDAKGVPLKDSFGNLMPLNGYRGVFIGNPNPTRPENCLHTVCEPLVGWSGVPEDGKTKVVDCKQVPNNVVKARAILIDGYDSPNDDEETLNQWPNLVSRKSISEFQPESESYWTQGRGVVKLGLAGLKIITKELCEQFGATGSSPWKDAQRIKIGALDAAYGGVGGDRCCLGWAEFGMCVDGKIRIHVHPWIQVPVKIRPDMIPEDQIATFAKQHMESVGVPPENFFFDGRGSVGVSMSRIWSPKVNSVEFGGRPTERIVGPDIFTIDEKTKQRRPKTAREAFSNYVSELWWCSRYCIESDQIRGLQMDIILDAQPREWCKVKGDKIQIETKKELRKRTGCSPDLADTFVMLVEGARQRGFHISKLSKEPPPSSNKDSWLRKAEESASKLRKSRTLQAVQ